MPTDVKVHNLIGEEVTLSKYLGNYLVIYFYPKDDTPGCTKEACSFRDFNKDIEELGAKIIGISKDNVKSHNKFIENHKLNFELLSDPETKLQDAFGVWAEKSMFGKKFIGTLRTTFLVNPDGNIVKVWEDVKPDNHAKEIYEELNKLIGKKD